MIFLFKDTSSWTASYFGQFLGAGVLCSDVKFGQLYEYDLTNSGQNMPFGRGSGVIGFDRHPLQASRQLSFMSVICNQIADKLQSKFIGDCVLNKNIDWKCSINICV